MNGEASARRARISETAASWVLRLAGPHGPAERAAFEAWRDEHVAHEIAFERELATWQRLDGLRTSFVPEPTPAPIVCEASPQPRAAQGWRRRFAVAASTMLLVGAGALTLGTITGAPAYATDIGERRLVRLADGSSVELNTDSRIVVRYARGGRMVELVRGEAVFHVRREARPFVIRAEAAQLDASGGDVSVRLTGPAAHVIVRSGTVLASEWRRMQPAAPVTSLGPLTESDLSESALAAGRTAVRAIAADAIDRALAWEHGAIALDGQTLADAVREFNRYNLRRIEIGDPAAGSLHVGGYFETTDVDGFVAALTRTFPVQAASRPNGDIVVSSRA